MDPADLLIIFDVESLYTNVPILTAITILRQIFSDKNETLHPV